MFIIFLFIPLFAVDYLYSFTSFKLYKEKYRSYSSYL